MDASSKKISNETRGLWRELLARLGAANYNLDPCRSLLCLHALVAHLVELRFSEPLVAGSSPALRTQVQHSDLAAFTFERGDAQNSQECAVTWALTRIEYLPEKQSAVGSTPTSPTQALRITSLRQRSMRERNKAGGLRWGSNSVSSRANRLAAQLNKKDGHWSGYTQWVRFPFSSPSKRMPTVGNEAHNLVKSPNRLAVLLFSSLRLLDRIHALPERTLGESPGTCERTFRSKFLVLLARIHGPLHSRARVRGSACRLAPVGPCCY